MYTLPNKLKLFAIIFMVVGAIGIVSGFMMAPKTTSEVKEMMASQAMAMVKIMKCDRLTG